MADKNKKILEIISFSFLGAIVVIATFLFSYQVTYANKIYRGVSIAGIDLSGKTKAQAKALLKKDFEQVLNQEFTLKSNNKEVKARISDTGLEIDLEETVDNSYHIGRDSNFFNQLYLSAKTLFKKQSVPAVPVIDKTKYADFQKIAVAQFNSQPVNATLAIESGQVQEVQEQNGIQINAENLDQSILGLINQGASRTIELESNIVPPGVKSADFRNAKKTAEGILSKEFHFTYDNKTYTPSKSEIGRWIAFQTSNGVITASLVQDNIMAYLGQIAKDFEIIKKDRKINALDGSVIDEGREGKLLDKKNAYNQIASQIDQKSLLNIVLVTNTVAPGEVKIFPAEGLVPGRFQGKYLDIDLASQKLCRIDGNNILDCFAVSSGKPGMDTPTGTYTINDKNPRHWSNKYKMWLPWWQRFIDEGYGIHELPETDTWKEVPDHLGTPVSHGCVRLGVGPAELVYNWTDIGTPIYIHK